MYWQFPDRTYDLNRVCCWNPWPPTLAFDITSAAGGAMTLLCRRSNVCFQIVHIVWLDWAVGFHGHSLYVLTSGSAARASGQGEPHPARVDTHPARVDTHPARVTFITEHYLHVFFLSEKRVLPPSWCVKAIERWTSNTLSQCHRVKYVFMVWLM